MRTPRISPDDIYEWLVGDEDSRVCKDIPDSACREVPGNFLVHLLASLGQKIGDELASARLVLPWVLAHVGAPAAVTGLLVPIRESGALLPQLVVAAQIRRLARRKWVWVAGAVVQGLAIAAAGLVVLALTGAAAGWAVLAALTVFSLARGLCSVAWKDVVGKTIPKTRRGTLMGYAGAMAGGVAVAVGLWLAGLGASARTGGFLAGLLLVAGLLWVAAGLVYATLRETPGASEGGGNALREAVASLRLLLDDATFRRFVVSRALLLSTALALPFYVALAARRTGGELGGLGLLMVTSGLAGALSSPVWGRFADRSSRRVMVGAAALAGLLGIAVYALTGSDLAAAQGPPAFAAYFFAMGLAHAGVRLGRKTYLVDMAGAERRATYVAVSNTVIGVALLAGGAFGVVAQIYGERAVILLLALMTLAGAALTASLPEAE